MALPKSLCFVVALLSVACSVEKKCEPLSTSTTYLTCIYNGLKTDCRESQNHGTVVTATCKAGHKSSGKRYPHITCLDGSWSDKLTQCKPDCGLEVGSENVLTDKKTIAKKGQVPWHVTVYELSAETGDYEHICGGTIVTNTFVLSAANCVWSEGRRTTRDAVLFKVVAGKFNRDYNSNTGDSLYRQIRDVKKFYIPKEYVGDSMYHRADILFIELDQPFEFSQHVSAVCIDGDHMFEDLQLKNTKGRVAGMGLISEDGGPSPELRYIDLPAKSYDECLLRVPETFKRYLTLDKVCAGYLNGTGVCSGDSGGGLSFPETSRGITRWYLRAIASVGVPSVKTSTISCVDNMYSAFTRVSKHMDWIENTIGYEI